jgi:hypothetical protein
MEMLIISGQVNCTCALTKALRTPEQAKELLRRAAAKATCSVRRTKGLR